MSQGSKLAAPNLSATGAVAASAASGNVVYAKTIVLGDHDSGRTELIRNLDLQSPASSGQRNQHKFNIVIDESNFFTTIELSAAELEHPNVTAYLKVWEHTQHLSKKDEELAFRGALFCIIAFDIRKQQSYRNVFEKWIPLKEQLAPDSFLYIVGTHLDESSFRQVELEEICKACARKDAIYVELSNTTSANLPLLRRLLCRRVHYMLEQRDFFASPAFQAKLKSISMNEEDDEQDDGHDDEVDHRRGKTHKPKPVMSLSSAHEGDLSIPILEPNILTHSIGSVLASGFDLAEWEGLEQHEQEIGMIAEKIDAFVEQLAQMSDVKLSDLDSVSLSDSLVQSDAKYGAKLAAQLSSEGTEETTSPLSDSYQQLREAFQILGLTVPESLLQHQHQEQQFPASEREHRGHSDTDPFAIPNSVRSSLRKMHVKLPGGHSADMVLDLDANVEQQVDLFLLGNGLNFDVDARSKLLQVTLKVQRDYFDSKRGVVGSPGQRSTPPSRPSTATNTVTSSVTSPAR